jgi:hypothetical protein
MNSPIDLKLRVMAAVQRMPSPPRSRLRREAQIVALVTFAAAAGLFFSFDGMSHGAGRPAWFLAASLGVWAAVAASASLGAWRRGTSFVRGSVASLVVIAVGTPLLLQAISIAFAWTHPALAALHAERIGFRCFALTLAAATCPLVGLSIVRRSSNPMHPIAGGAALGVASGACAGLMVILWCPVAAPMHMAVGHVLPIAFLAMIGSVLGHHVMAIRATRFR